MDLNIDEIYSNILQPLGQPKYRAEQLFTWLHKGAEIDEMHTLPKALREQLKSNFTLGGVKVYKRLVSQIDRTTKYLFLLEDNNIIEGVLMRYKYGNTICISSQVGCRMGCAFCASTLGGLVRNLYPGEMLGQVLAVNKALEETESDKISNIVIMGSGEPLDNFENVVKFLQLVNHEKGLNISMRNISLSTCGLADKITELADMHLGITLAISLHAPTDEVRQQLLPIARKYELNQLMKAVRAYVAKTGRRVVFEYALIKDVNDSDQCANELAELVKGLQCHVNLIPLNEVRERELKASTPKQVSRFKQILDNAKISNTVRRKMGADIFGACGQLRRSIISKEE